MIWAKDLISDLHVTHVLVHQSFGGDEVVQPPAHVLGPGVHHVRPEGVALFFVRIKVSKSVDKSFIQEVAKA